MKRPIDWRLYLVTGRRIAGARPIEDVVCAAARGGVTAVQFREKECGTREFVEWGRRLKTLLVPFGVPLMVNDRVDVALAVGAGGVHIGQSDMKFRDARALLGPGAAIGLSVETMEQAQEAESLDVAYLGVSPVFATPTKTDTAPEWGLAGLGRLRAASRHVLVAIGGITLENAAEVIKAGAGGVAVVSAICGARDPESAARELRRVVDAAREFR
jgi:thiamine-phosphate pyrophosphorylase